MAIGLVAPTNHQSAHYNGGITILVVLCCFMAATGGLIYGYDLGISGGVSSMEPFLNNFFPDVLRKMRGDKKISNYCKFDSQLLTLFTSSLYIAALISPYFASPITKAFGRRPSIIVAGTTALAGAALGGAAINLYMLILGRVLLGCGLGFAAQAIPLYISEMALPRHRGAMNMGFELGVALGVLTANLTNFGTQKIKEGWGWRISLSMVAIPASFLILGALTLPETPNSLIHNTKDPEKAKRVLQRIRGTKDVESELSDLIRASEISVTSETGDRSQFRTILRRKYRPQLVMAIVIPIFQQVTGINVITFYAPILFRTIGLGESAALMAAVVIGGVSTLFIFVSMLVVDKFGRRMLFVMGGAQMLLAQTVIGGIMANKLGDHGVLSKGYGYLVLVMVCVYVGGFGCSWGPLRWLVPSEIFSLDVRSAGQSITVSVGFFCTFAISQSILAMLCHFKYGIFFFFGAWLVVMTTFVYLFLPETKGVPIEHMDQVWKGHWFWKNIVSDLDPQKKLQEA